MLKFKLKNTKEILKVLNVAEKIISKNIENEVLKYILFKNNNDKLRIEFMNASTSVIYDLNVEYIEGDSLLYNNKTLITLLSLLSGEVEINNGEIKNEKCKYKVPFIEAINNNRYPEINIEEKQTESVKFEEFKKAIDNVIVSVDKLPGVMSGIYFGDGELASCDSKRVSMSKLNLNISDIILPKYVATDLLKLPFEEDVFVYLSGNKIIIKDSNISISSALINGKYPKYNAVLPKEEMYTICVDSNKLQDALNLMAPVLNEEMIINLKITEENINLSANSKGNEGNTNVELCSNKNNINKDEEINIKFNAQYLLDALKNEDNELIISTYKDSIGIMFSFYNVKHFIMPISKK